MRTAELRRLTDEELGAELASSLDELFNLRFQLSTRQLKDQASLARARRKVARVLTLRRERELESALASDKRDG